MVLTKFSERQTCRRDNNNVAYSGSGGTEWFEMRWVAALSSHVIGLGVNGGGLAWDVAYLTENGEPIWQYRGYGGKFNHLTFWSQVV